MLIKLPATSARDWWRKTVVLVVGGEKEDETDRRPADGTEINRESDETRCCGMRLRVEGQFPKKILIQLCCCS